MKKALVTGGAGFIGSNLVDLYSSANISKIKRVYEWQAKILLDKWIFEQ